MDVNLIKPRAVPERRKLLAPPPLIRPARESDIPRVLEIEHLTFGEQWDYYQFKASLHDIFLVYVDPVSRQPAGFLIACCCKLTQRGMILRIAVHPQHQGKGIATQLMKASFKKLKEMDLGEVELDVDILKAGAVRLYEKVGFRVVEAFSPSIEDDDSFYIMRKKLG